MVAEGAGLSEIVSDLRFEAVSFHNSNVKAAIVVPTRLSQLTYGPLVAEIKCFSRLKPGFHYRGLFPLGQMSEGQARTKAGVLAGALAENLCAVYKDKLNCSEWARDGLSAFDQALRKLHARQPTPPKPDASIAMLVEALRGLTTH